MYDVQWANVERWKDEDFVTSYLSRVILKNIHVVLNIFWEEHCVECAIPECYTQCALYKKRIDGACSRFVYGIYPNENFRGLFNFGADIRFRKWSKIECDLTKSFPLPPVLLNASSLLQKLPPIHQRKLINGVRKITPSAYAFDHFIIECYSQEEDSFKLYIEHFTENLRFRKSKFRKSFVLQKGYNFFCIPYDEFNIQKFEGYVCLYPETVESTRRIIFTWLDFIKIKNPTQPFVKLASPKIKCVAWDLDNTLWQGTLINGDRIKPADKAVELVKELDKKGIVQTILSKNNYDEAMDQLKVLGLGEYFIYPAINWGQKSKNLIEISARLNINLDSFAVIEDSPFERNEIQTNLPEVRVYEPIHLDSLLNMGEFDIIVSELSKSRRLSYLAETRRQEIKEAFSGDYDCFLESCQMILTAFVPERDDEIVRCFELVQRSNQLNLSTKRYSQAELVNLLCNPKHICIGLSCKDKFGDYGIIGFVNFSFDVGIVVLHDFVLSCRVAQKKVEYSFFYTLFSLLKEEMHTMLKAKFIKTYKNGPLQKALEDLKFRCVSSTGINLQDLEVDLTADFSKGLVMKVQFAPLLVSKIRKHRNEPLKKY